MIERIKQLCRAQKIPISKLERECGFANGYIGQLKKGNIPYERLEKISKVLGVSVSYLATGKEGTESIETDPDIQLLLYLKSQMEPSQFHTHVEYIAALYKQSHPNDEMINRR